MSDKPQDTPMSSPPAASPSTEPQNHQVPETQPSQDKPQDTPMSSPPAASPSTEPQNHQDAITSQLEDIDMLITAANDLYPHLADLIAESKVEECKDDSSEPPLTSVSRISDCTAMIQKLKAIIDQSLAISMKKKSESAAMNERFNSEILQLAVFLKEVTGYEAPKGSEGLLDILRTVRFVLEMFFACKKISQPEADDHARRKEQENLSEELRNIEQRLRSGTPGMVTTEGSKYQPIISSIHQHINEMQNRISSLSADLLLLEEEKEKKDKAHSYTRTKIQQAKQSTRVAEQDLEKCKAELEQAKLEASSAKAAEALLASNMGKLLDRTQDVLSRIEFPREVLSMEIPDKVGWLAIEHERTCMDLIAMKQNLAHANSELSKRSADLKAAEFKAEKLVAVEDVEDAISLIEFPEEILHPEQTIDRVRWLACDNKRTCEELAETKLNLERAKGALDKRSTDLKAAELEVERLVAELSETIRTPVREANEEGSRTETARGGGNEVISLSEFPQEIVSRWLAGKYERTCKELGVTEGSLKLAKDELNKCFTDLKAAELKAEGLHHALEDAICLIEFPMEIRAEQSLDKVRWLAGDYKKTCEVLGATKLNLEQAKRKLDMRTAELILEREYFRKMIGNKEDSDAGTCSTERPFQARAADALHSNSGRRYSVHNSQVQLQAPSSAIAPQAFHHGSASAYQQQNTHWGVNSMSYGSQAEQLLGGNYNNSGLSWMHTADLHNVQTDGDQWMPHSQPDNRRSEFFRGMPEEQGSGSRPHGRGTGR